MKYPASCVVHWPTGPVYCCEKHGRALVGLSKHLGHHIVITKLIEEQECSNCKSEEEN